MLRRKGDITPLLRTSRLPASMRLRIGPEIVATYVEVRWRMVRGDIRNVVAALRPDDGGRYDTVTAQRMGLRLAHPVRRTLDPLPFDSRCLMRSLVLLRMLARRGVVCELVIGVRPAESFQAHAWIEHAGRPLLPTNGYEALTVL